MNHSKILLMSPDFISKNISKNLLSPRQSKMNWSLFQSQEWNNILSQNVGIYAKYRYRTDAYGEELENDVLNHKQSISAYLKKLNTFVTNIQK